MHLIKIKFVRFIYQCTKDDFRFYAYTVSYIMKLTASN